MKRAVDLKSRFTKLGIKQTIQLSWMDRVVKMMLSGMTEQQIRQDLDEFLSTQKQSGGVGERGKVSYTMAISILACWFAPAPDLKDFRDRLLLEAGKRPQKEWLALHWAIISATYPFWLSLARQVGRLFNLQDQISQPQIFNRLKEQYGDRETVARNARYAVRSMVAWGVIKDSAKLGVYEPVQKVQLDKQLALLLLESTLSAGNGVKLSISSFTSDPANFVFNMPLLNMYDLAHQQVLSVQKNGLIDEMVEIG